jgi:hypothetical protein
VRIKGINLIKISKVKIGEKVRNRMGEKIRVKMGEKGKNKISKGLRLKSIKILKKK